MAHPSECQVINQVFGSVFCQSFNCSKRADYSIGRLIGPMSLRMNLCEQCTVDLLVNSPDALWEQASLVRAARKTEEDTKEEEVAATLAAEKESAMPVFACSKCGATFRNALVAEGHQKKCTGGGD